MALLRECRWPLGLGLALGLFLVVWMPPYSGPDEKGHVAYVAALAHWHLPRSAPASVADIATGTTWQSQHPPLFYAACVPAFVLAQDDPARQVMAVRLVCVVGFLAVIATAFGLASLYLPPAQARTVALLVALHPTLAYICCMANNEGWATAAALAALWAGALAGSRAKEEGSKSRLAPIAWCALWCGVCLLTKWTGAPAVAVAAFMAGNGLPRGRRAITAALVCTGAFLLWLPWGLMVRARYGVFLPNPFPHAAFSGGLGAALLFPAFALRLVVLTGAEFLTGLASTYWLWQSDCGFSFFSPERSACGYACPECLGLEAGAVCTTLGLLWLAARAKGMRFAFLLTGGIYLVVLLQVTTRDDAAITFAARYVPIAVAVLAIPVVKEASLWPLRLRQAAGALWAGWACFAFAKLLLFFRPRL